MRTRNKPNNKVDVSKDVNVKLLRSYTCVDVVKQLPGNEFNPDNWRIACDYCDAILQGTLKRKRRVNKPSDPRMRCSQYLFDEIIDGKITISTLKYNILCQIMQEKPIEINEVIYYPSKHAKQMPFDSIPPLIPSSPPLETIHTPMSINRTPVATPPSLPSPDSATHTLPIIPFITHATLLQIQSFLNFSRIYILASFDQLRAIIVVISFV